MSAVFQYEFVTSTVSLHKNDGIVCHVLNHGTESAHVRIRIHKNTGAGAVLVHDGGDYQIVQTWSGGVGHTVQQSGEYWLQIKSTSDRIVPKVSFERVEGGIWKPFAAYAPGDFAVFQLIPDQKRIW